MTRKPKSLTRRQAWMRLCEAFCEAAAEERYFARVDGKPVAGICHALKELPYEPYQALSNDLRRFVEPDYLGGYCWPRDPEGHSARAFACWLMAQPEYPR